MRLLRLGNSRDSVVDMRSFIAKRANIVFKEATIGNKFDLIADIVDDLFGTLSAQTRYSIMLAVENLLLELENQ